MEYRYEIEDFNWNKETNTFYADAWNLMCQLPDGSIHPEVFPNGKKEFYIHNNSTGGFRRFRFLKESTEKFTPMDSDGNYFEFELSSWLFESEDGIKCSICVEEI
jgi:hypothetical protein